ncbi:MAG: hypothetical protein HY985_19610 [Magnetospirillum sp.]|nr:hypothetical protein [Magnetospirillum sp.]
MTIRNVAAVATVAATLALGGCVTKPSDGQMYGTGGGALGGAVIGRIVGGYTMQATLIGAAVGAAAGYVAGTLADPPPAESAK